MSKPLIIIVALYVLWRLLSTFGRPKRKPSRDGVRGRGSRRDEDYKDLTKQEISDADYEEIQGDGK